MFCQIEINAREISKNLPFEIPGEACEKNIQLLEDYLKSLNSANVHRDMANVEEKRKKLSQWLTSLRDTAEYIQSSIGCTNTSFPPIENYTKNLSFKDFRKSDLCTICDECNWINCQCDSESNLLLEFQMSSEVFPESPGQINKKSEMEKFWSKLPVKGTHHCSSTPARGLRLQESEIGFQNPFENLILNNKSTLKFQEKIKRSQKKEIRNLMFNFKKSTTSKISMKIKILSEGHRILGGGGKKVSIPKLRILAPGRRQINILSTIFRSLDKYWFIFDNHKKCPLSGETSCTFCAFRNISQRLNQRKRETNIMPHEILMQQTKLSQGVDIENTRIESMIKSTVNYMSDDNEKFSKSMNLQMVCQDCGDSKQLGVGSLININNDLKEENLKLILENYIHCHITKLLKCCPASEMRKDVLTNTYLTDCKFAFVS